VRTQRIHKAGAVILFHLPCLLVLFDDVVAVVVNVARGDEARLHMRAHLLLIEIKHRRGLALEDAAGDEALEIRGGGRIDNIRIGIGVRRQIYFCAVHMEQIVGTPGGQCAGFFGVHDVVGHGGNFGGEFRAGGESAKGLDTHGWRKEACRGAGPPGGQGGRITIRRSYAKKLAEMSCQSCFPRHCCMAFNVHVMNVRHLLALLPALLLTCCGTPMVKQIAGDKVPENLAEHLCKSSWKAPDGTVCTFRIEDEAKGMVEMRTLRDGEEDKSQLAFRTLGERMVVTVRGKEQAENGEPAAFCRAAIGDDHIALFLPDNEVLKNAVKNGLVAGKIHEDTVWWGTKDEKNVKKQKIEIAVLEKFGLIEAEKLGGVLDCFDADPATVLVREVAPPPKAKTGKTGRNKR
jgi:hypothetical protein